MTNKTVVIDGTEVTKGDRIEVYTPPADRFCKAKTEAAVVVAVYPKTGNVKIKVTAPTEYGCTITPRFVSEFGGEVRKI